MAVTTNKRSVQHAAKLYNCNCGRPACVIAAGELYYRIALPPWTELVDDADYRDGHFHYTTYKLGNWEVYRYHYDHESN